MLEYSKDELLSMTVPEIDPHYSKEGWAEAWQIIRERKSFVIESTHRSKSGRIFPVEIAIIYIEFDNKEFHCAFTRDISERKFIESQTKASLKEKEVLLKEIHHRVKNNMQIISSILKLQVRYIEDESMRDIFVETQNRINSMALIHEKLYQTKTLSVIDFHKYIKSLADSLIAIYGTNLGLIHVKINAENIYLDIDDAIPGGLIINELLSNALKHAFKDSGKGDIFVDFYLVNDDEIVIIVKDNGIGLPKDIDLDTTQSLGLRLVKILTEQIQGNIEVCLNKGTEFIITFQSKGLSNAKNKNPHR
jgi:two-component sensor histidine kinase